MCRSCGAREFPVHPLLASILWTTTPRSSTCLSTYTDVLTSPQMYLSRQETLLSHASLTLACRAAMPLHSDFAIRISAAAFNTLNKPVRSACTALVAILHVWMEFESAFCDAQGVRMHADAGEGADGRA